jgi:DNA polymerase-1
MPILSKMEIEGVFVDKVKLKSLSADFDINIKKLTKEIHDLCNEEFNIASPKQLSHILFEKLDLPAGKKSKTGSFSTNSDILEELDIAGHEVAGKVLQWRHMSKLKSTYADALQESINKETGRIHTTFSNISTSTGRLSSNSPNIQNIPIRTSEGRKIRNAFTAKKGHKFILADYSQIELRVLAHISDIKNLKEAFREDKDIHTITAAQIFGISESEVDSDIRRKAKAINFGIIYGISAFGLAKQLRIDRKDASNYIKSYFETYPGIKEFMDNYQDLAQQHGYVTTITGRKCFINGIDSKNPIVKGLAQRLAINAPIQGSAADIIKKAMIDLDDSLSKSNLKAKMILQVHDELILEVPDGEVEEVKELLKKTMENAFFLDLPLKVDVSVRQEW